MPLNPASCTGILHIVRDRTQHEFSVPPQRDLSAELELMQSNRKIQEMWGRKSRLSFESSIDSI